MDTGIPQIKVLDSSNELYKDLTPETWSGDEQYVDCTLSDITDFRTIIGDVIGSLLWMDHQYRNKQTEVSPHYSLLPARTCHSFRLNSLEPMLSYHCCAEVNKENSSYYCVTDYTDLGFRPLFKDYEKFIISNLMFIEEYYELPFLMAVQRTAYLWLSNISTCFEYRGSVLMTVLWAYSDPELKHYNLFHCKIVLDFDLTECYSDGLNKITPVFSIKLGLPSGLFRNTVEKSKFADDQDFYDHLWQLRISEIHKRIKEKYDDLLKCREDISDIN